MTTRKSRESLLYPIAIPLGALVAIVAVLFLFSRVLLRVSPTAATVTALVVAAGIMVVSSVVVSRQRVTGAAMVSMFGGVLGVAMLAGGLALLVGQPKPEAEPVVLALAAPPQASVNGYSTNALTAPAATPFTIAFDNQEDGVQHNVEIADGDPAKGGQVLAETAVITGPAKTDYAYDALDAGTYTFFCKIHPTTMIGTLEVAEGAPSGGPPAVQLVAEGQAFDTSAIDLPADTASQIDFQNKDPNTQHNVAIYADETSTDALFKGEVLMGPASATYDVPALPAGTYVFRCDIHPTTMKGTVTVGGGPAPSATSPPTSTATVTPTESPPGGGGGGGPVSTVISAANLAFDTDQLRFEAGKAATLHFQNDEDGIAHNVAIYTDESLSQPLFVGELIIGPKGIDYAIPALPAGTYFFRCDPHPAMAGTVTVT